MKRSTLRKLHVVIKGGAFVTIGNAIFSYNPAIQLFERREAGKITGRFHKLSEAVDNRMNVMGQESEAVHLALVGLEKKEKANSPVNEAVAYELAKFDKAEALLRLNIFNMFHPVLCRS